MGTQIKIAITGGPSGGKTTLIEALQKDLGQKCAVVPEAASILYRGGFPRYREAIGLIHAQKAIYYTQRELESLVSAISQKPLIVCDRGSLDAIAYWPDSEADFFTSIHSSKAQELARYDWVLHLDTADHNFYDISNPIRTETHQEAAALNSAIKNAWSGHPRRIVISHSEDFFGKMATSLSVIKAILAQKSSDEIQKEILK